MKPASSVAAHQQLDVFGEVCLVGACNAGKTAFMAAASKEKAAQAYIADLTISSADIDLLRAGKRVLAWNIPGLMRNIPQNPSSQHFAKARAILIFLDSTSTLSINQSSLEFWLNEIRTARSQSQIFVILTKVDAKANKSSLEDISRLVQRQKGVAFLGACSAIDDVSCIKTLETLCDLTISKEKIPPLLTRIRNEALDTALLTVAAECQPQDIEENAKTIFLLMSVYLSNPLHEKSDSFFRSCQRLYLELYETLNLAYEKLIASCIEQGYFPIDPEVSASLGIVAAPQTPVSRDYIINNALPKILEAASSAAAASIAELEPLVRIKSQSMPWFSNASSKRLALDLQTPCAGTWEQKLKRDFQLLTVYFSNPYEEKPDKFFQVIEPIYHQLRKKLPLSIITACKAEGNFPVEVEAGDEWIIMDDTFPRLAKSLTKALISCLYSDATKTAAAIARILQLSKCPGLDMRINLLSIEKEIQIKISSLKRLSSLQFFIETFLKQEQICADSTLTKDLRGLLAECQSKVVEAANLAIVPAEELQVADWEQHWEQLTALKPDDVVARIQLQASAYLIWCHRNLPAESSKTLAEDIQRIIQSTPNELVCAQHVLHLMSYYFCQLDVKAPNEFARRLYALYLQLMISLIRQAPAVIVASIEAGAFPLHTNVCKILPSDGIFVLDREPFQLIQPTVAVVLKHYHSDELAQLYLAKSRMMSEAQDSEHAIVRLLTACLRKHSLTCDFPRNRLNDVTTRASRAIIRQIRLLFESEAQISPDSITGVAIRHQLSRYETCLVQACLALVRASNFTLEAFNAIQDPQLQAALKKEFDGMPLRMAPHANQTC